MKDLQIKSFIVSSRDVPHRWCLVSFLGGCNFRCRHCHNWRIVLGLEETRDTESMIYELENLPFLEVFVISGGEPTIYDPEDLISLIERVKEVRPDIKVRVDTNGYMPEVVKVLKPFVDGFAVDIKAPLGRDELYSYVTNRKVDTSKIEETVRLVDGMEYTIYRTPRYPWLKEEHIEEIRDFTSKLSSPWYLNEFMEVRDCPF